MRPIRLELSGFTTFREPAVVEFGDADLFALTGPTGSGKSSLIDAIAFALYGSVPRLGKQLVAPVISLGLLECKVRFDFSVGDEVYTAVRIVRRAAGRQGATTKEARLERAGEVIAGDAKALTAEVERVLGLTFDHFTKCVVLPQGEFARFLNDAPRDRQDLLVELLDLEMYGRMQQQANLAAAAAQAAIVAKKQRLEEELAYATPEALEGTRARAVALDVLWASVEDAGPRIESLSAGAADARRRMEEAGERVRRLVAVEIPAQAGDLAAEIARARAARTKAEAAVEKAEAGRAKAAEALEALPARGPLEAAFEAHRTRADLVRKLGMAREAAAGLEKVEAEAQKAVDEALEAGRAAADAVEAAKIQHRALDLARTLAAGEPCPVCRQPVHEVPHLDSPADLVAAERAHAKAQEAWKRLSEAHRKAAAGRSDAEGRCRALAEQVAAADERLREHADAAALSKSLSTVDKAEKALEAARAREVEARAAAQKAAKALEALAGRENAGWAALEEARLALADMKPPPVPREDLAAAWGVLASWAAKQAPLRRKEAEEAAVAVTAAEVERDRLLAALADACRAAGVEPGANLRDAVVRERERTAQAVERISGALEEAARVRSDLAAATEEQQVASSLARHLGTKGFEAWILEEALGLLVEGASRILRDLSGEQYSLTLDSQGQFAVIDHRNADEPRPAKTLSGGETFLASLALALALSEHLADLAAEGARLESIFLDEGFGTLDAETLDVVAAAIENLSAGGRVVGLVTHVREIADRMPVRYVVTKGPHTSTVSKVVA